MLLWVRRQGLPAVDDLKCDICRASVLRIQSGRLHSSRISISRATADDEEGFSDNPSSSDDEDKDSATQPTPRNGIVLQSLSASE